MPALHLVLGDCVEVMQRMAPDSIDAVVCDPPYGLEFMGKDWDRLDQSDAWRAGGGTSKVGIGEREIPWPSFGGGDTANATCAVCGGRMRGAKKCDCAEPVWRVKGKALEDANRHDPSRAGNAMQAWHEQWAREALRVLKPGGHLIAFGGSRTYHRLACAVEDAGFEIRDQLQWLYGQGFPKSMDVAKAIDKARGVKGELGAPKSEDARTWAGWGTALKPAHEPIVLARKPLVGTVAKNVLAHGTGALNIEASRVGYTGNDDKESARVQGRVTSKKSGSLAAEPDAARDVARVEFEQPETSGRWPSNVILSHHPECGLECHPDCAVGILDTQTGMSRSRDPGTVVKQSTGADVHGNAGPAFGAESRPSGTVMLSYGDSGGASRFFYVAKASKSERNAGLDAFPVTTRGAADNAAVDNSLKGPTNALRPDQATRSRNDHPTVKPLALMHYLCTLVTPSGGTVLDPFVGSGTTAISADQGGFDCIGIERDPHYFDLAVARVSHWTKETSTLSVFDEHGEWRQVG